MVSGRAEPESADAGARRIRVLFLGANPPSTEPLRIDRELRGIQERLRASRHRGSVEIIVRLAVRFADLREALLEVEPDVVHFSGHGTEEREIVLEDEYGLQEHVDSDALAGVFGVLKGRIRVVVVNACFGRGVAEVVTQHVGCAIGAEDRIRDDAAVEFARVFYEAIGFGRSVQEAFDLGVVALKRMGGAGANLPELVVREGVNAREVVLVRGAPLGASSPRIGRLVHVPEPRAGGLALPALEHFIGRDPQTEALERALLDDAVARIIVLGSGGIGKTTLTLAALHRREVEKRYGTRRWFVRLDAAATADAAVGKIREVLGLSSSGHQLAEVKAALANAPGVLVLDNLETPWEGELSATEALLGELAQIPGLRIVVSVRGGHKPAGVAWSKAIQLAPLSLEMAGVLFDAIAPEHTGDARVRPLLAKLGGVPLAIVLLARTAEGDDLGNLAADWWARRTALLERHRAEPDRLSSWAVSVELSLASKRMTPEARRLGALLAALPGGIAVLDLEAVFAGGRGAARVLSQVGLGFFEGGRLQMLPPIREHMLLVHPVAVADLDGAIAHYGRLARQLALEMGKDPAAAGLARLAPEAPNMSAMSVAAARKGEYESALEELMYAMHEIDSTLADLLAMHQADPTLAERYEAVLRGYEQLIRDFKWVGRIMRDPAACIGYEATCILKVGDVALAKSEYENAYSRYEEALQLYKQVNDVLGEARAIARQKLAKEGAKRRSGRAKRRS